MVVRHCGVSLQELGQNLKQTQGEGFPSSCVATIGNFDGVHTGHMELIRRTVEKGHELGLPAIGITFYPHPSQLLRGREFSYLTLPARRSSLLMEAGLDALVVLPFTPDLASRNGADFCRNILKGELGVEQLIVGYDFRLGSDRSGVEELKSIGQQEGFEVTGVDAVLYENRPISSSRIRAALEEGRIKEATAMLGREHCVYGEVVHGVGRGGPLLGYPTANVDVKYQAMPLPAVYATRTRIVENSPFDVAQEDVVYYFSKRKNSAGASSTLCPPQDMSESLPEKDNIAGVTGMAGMTSFGRNPTFGGQRLTLETFILDFTGDLYGKIMEVAFCGVMRQEQKFSGPDELVAQLRADEMARRQWG